ncbi:membrane protein [Fibrobacterales bacterium]|nr:membrane protein [Fibrobacterales bacterium]
MSENTIEVANSASNELESKFDGGVLSFIGYSILVSLISTVTLGICLPWALCIFWKWEIDHTIINGNRLKFNGSGTSLFGHWILWWLLCIITLGIYGFWVYIAFAKWKTKHTIFA